MRALLQRLAAPCALPAGDALAVVALHTGGSHALPSAMPATACRTYAKAASGVSGGDQGGGGPISDAKIQKLLKLLEPVEAEERPMTEEERAEAQARAKEYSRLKMKQHREWQANLTHKLKLKHAAIAALPEELRAAAAAPDYELFPPDRDMFTDTPPIKSYRLWKERQRRAGQ